MRGALREQVTVAVVPCQRVMGQTGGVALVEQPDHLYTLPVRAFPDRKSERRHLGTLRPRERRVLYPAWDTGIRQGDNVYFPDDNRAWRCMQRRLWPRHLELEVEVEG